MQAAAIEQVELEITIHAELERVWKGLVKETTFWWPKDFYAGPKAKGFYIEAKLGGKMYEDWGDKSGVIWYDVFAVDPPHSLDLRGCLAVPYGPALSLLQIKLSAVAGGTVLRLSDTVFGVSSRDDQESKRDGWKQVFENGLKKYVETHA
jgi:uncharacterized protein YndB with AHSA1/START domain